MSVMWMADIGRWGMDHSGIGGVILKAP